MKTQRAKLIATSGLFVAIVGMTSAAFAQYPQQGPPPPPPGYQQGPPPPQGGWEVPPPEFQEVQRQGFHDGVEGARHDFDNHRPPSVENREEFRHPHVPPSLRHDYREAFRRGYQVGVEHIYNHDHDGPR